MNQLGDGNNYAMSNLMKIGIIGNGIAAWCVNKYLLNKDKNLEILRFGNDSFLRTCSLRTTSINCMRGTQKGISPLGDLMVDSMLEFERFIQEFPNNGSIKTYETQCWLDEESKFTKRFHEYKKINSVQEIELSHEFLSYQSEAYLINPPAFYHGLELNDVKANLVTSVNKRSNGFHLETDKGEFEVDKLFLCAGVNNSLFQDLINDDDTLDFIKRTKPVKGDYLYLNTQHNIRPKSIAIENHHLIFRENEILIGSTSFNDNDIQLVNHTKLRKVYEHIQDSIRFELPSYEKFDAICGIRAKGRKRMPKWGKVGDNLYFVGGLYKNAFSFAFKAAKDLCHDVFAD